MAQRTLPGLGLTAFWDEGYDGWGDENDVNLRLLSALVQATAINKVSATPGSPSDGDIYIFSGTHPTQANKIALRDNGAWVYITPKEGWLVYNQTGNYFERFDGANWAPYLTEYIAAGFAPSVDAPTLTVFRHQFATAVSLPSALAGSKFSSTAAATATADYDIRKNGVSIGTLSWAAAATTPTVTFASATSFAAGDILDVVGPLVPDDTLAGITMTFLGAKL